jgi:Type I restriction modification DNA specificity domain.
MKIIEEWEKFRYGLRFQLFKQFKNDSVKVKPTKNLINYEQPTKYIVSDNNYSQNPLSTPVLTANKAFILGYTNERFGIYDKGDCIIFDDFTMDMKYVTFPFKVKSSAIKILKPKSNINLRYVFEYLLSLNLKSGEHKRHYISEIASKTIPLLKRGQQNTIASLFLSLDYKIVIEKSLLSTYQEQKKYLLRNLFI